MSDETSALAIRVDSAIEKALVQNDLSLLTAEQRISYVKAICDSLGLNPLTQPFAYITLNGKLTLYAKRDATDQLRKLHKISTRVTKNDMVGDGVYVVTAEAVDMAGRTDSSIGAVSIKGLTGDALANAVMKAETKAKRRVTLSIVGLGFLDETELETVNTSPAPVSPAPAPKLPPVVTHEAAEQMAKEAEVAHETPKPVGNLSTLILDKVRQSNLQGGATENQVKAVQTVLGMSFKQHGGDAVRKYFIKRLFNVEHSSELSKAQASAILDVWKNNVDAVEGYVTGVHTAYKRSLPPMDDDAVEGEAQEA